MNVKQIIPALPDFKKTIPAGTLPNEYLKVSEFFCDTIQGEGVNIGMPSVFLRLQGCTLTCKWCDIQEAWGTGNPYTFDELFDLMDKFSLVEKLKWGQHLVITGGSPLLQQKSLFFFFCHFHTRYGFLPYIEIENECTIMPNVDIADAVSCWNNSPKLCNSGNKKSMIYNPKIIKYLSMLNNSWFKFVIQAEEDWQEIQTDYIDTKLIEKNKIILMPEGSDRINYMRNVNSVIEMAVIHGVRFSSREQVVLWDSKIGM